MQGLAERSAEGKFADLLFPAALSEDSPSPSDVRRFTRRVGRLNRWRSSSTARADMRRSSTAAVRRSGRSRQRRRSTAAARRTRAGGGGGGDGDGEPPHSVVSALAVAL